MRTGRYRVWQFLHPDLDRRAVGGRANDINPAAGSAAGNAFGLQLSPTGGAAMIEEHAAVRQALLLLLSTRPGERIMRPSYGCDLQRLLFSPNDDTTAGLAIYYVRQAIETWEPRVHILKLDANANPGFPNQLDILLEYQLRSQTQSATQPPPEILAFTVDLAGE